MSTLQSHPHPQHHDTDSSLCTLAASRPADDEKCITCESHAPSFKGASHCTNCWEVEGRLQDYARSEKGRLFIAQVLEGSLQ